MTERTIHVVKHDGPMGGRYWRERDVSWVEAPDHATRYDTIGHAIIAASILRPHMGRGVEAETLTVMIGPDFAESE